VGVLTRERNLGSSQTPPLSRLNVFFGCFLDVYYYKGKEEGLKGMSEAVPLGGV